MAVSDIKVAVIGAGWIATHGHLPGYGRAGARAAAIADSAPGVAEQVGRDHGVARWYEDWREMLAREKPDVVSVCVPNAFHREVAEAALESGAHVLCEKPLATSAADAESMFATAKRAGMHLMAAQNQRFRPVNERIKGLIEAGELGHIYHAEAHYVRRLGTPTWGSFTQSRLSGGGALLDIGVHVIDCAFWFMGSPRPVEVSAQVKSVFGTRPEIAAAGRNAWDPAAFDVDDFAAALVRFEDGSTMSVQSSWTSHSEGDREYVRVLGTEAGAINTPPTLYRLREGHRLVESLSARRAAGWQECVAHFLAVVHGSEHARVRPEETMSVQRILDAAYESSRTGRAVRLDQ